MHWDMHYATNRSEGGAPTKTFSSNWRVLGLFGGLLQAQRWQWMVEAGMGGTSEVHAHSHAIMQQGPLLNAVMHAGIHTTPSSAPATMWCHAICSRHQTGVRAHVRHQSNHKGCQQPRGYAQALHALLICRPGTCGSMQQPRSSEADFSKRSGNSGQRRLQVVLGGVSE